MVYKSPNFAKSERRDFLYSCNYINYNYLGPDKFLDMT